MMRRQYGAWRRFELTGQVTPIHSPALVDVVGRVPGAPPEWPMGSQPATSLSRAGSYMPPVAAGMAPSGGGHRASGVTRGLPAAHARVGAAVVAKPKDARVGVIEREDIWGRPVAPCLARWGARPRSRRVAPRPPQARSP